MPFKPCCILVTSFASCWFLSVAVMAQQTDRFQPSMSAESVQSLEEARDLRGERRFDEAEEAIRGLLEQEPRYYRAQYNLALVEAMKGESDAALAAFTKALKIKEEEGIVDASLNNSIGWLYLLRGEFDEAEKYLQNALKELEVDEKAYESTRSKIYNNLGTLYLYTGELDRAREYLEIAKTQFSSRLAAQNLKMLNDVQRTVRNKAERQQP